MDYIVHSNDIYFGYSTTEVRNLAYQLGKKLNVQMPQSWEDNSMAGEDWMSSFLKRNPQLSIRKPEATITARATGFIKPTVQKFFNSLKDVIDRYKFSAQNI